MKHEEDRKEGRLVAFGNGEKALLVGVFPSPSEKETSHEHLKELHSLSLTYGVTPTYELLCPLRQIVSATYLGSGKVAEIAQLAEEHQVDLVIFDEEISPQQQRNLEKLIQKAVIDRTELILGVFAKRAQTKEAKIQIKLAQYRYQLPRLTRLWTHLGRQRTGGGSGGFLKGEGERQIEIDRRILKTEIAQLQKQLKQVQAHRMRQREARKKSHIPTFALVGYTNAGKSTLLNTLTQAGVFVEDKLFATLDTTTRLYQLPSREKILLIDTVGFIRKLPHNLVASFKSTLEEAAYADALIHVVDASNPSAQEQVATTLEVLQELGAMQKPRITVLNKVDACTERASIQKLQFFLHPCITISAKQREGLDKLVDKIHGILSQLRKKVTLRLDQSQYSLFCDLQEQGRVVESWYEGNDLIFTIELPEHLLAKVEKYQVKG